MNCRKDMLDFDLGLIVCVVSKCLYRGHEAAPKDTSHKRGGGVCGSLLAYMRESGGEEVHSCVHNGGGRSRESPGLVA
jgi:hypothetical protein